MNRRTLALGLLIPFLLLTAYALVDVGLFGIFAAIFRDSGGLQVGADLVVALILVLTWLIQDARRQDRNPWPWVVLTLIAGSISPLLYLATGKSEAATA